jgi:two-component system, chemotaxis family, CheB/CheR fusion protein
VPETPQEFEELLGYLKTNRGFDFTGYKRASLKRRIDKRLQETGFTDYLDYLDQLEVHPDELAHLFDTILINVTRFFRDPEAWQYIADHVVPELIATRAPQDPIRVWSAACASGEEAYTLAMIFAEALGAQEFRERVKIYATDVDEPALEKARHAGYTEREAQSVPEDLRARYFEANTFPYNFRSDLRRSIIFGRHDLVQDAPISHIDLLVCRNTLMYFNAETQSRILGRFHFALNDAAFLMLGKVEMLLGHAHLFSPVDLKRRIFRQVTQDSLRERLGMMAENRTPSAVSTSSWGGRHVDSTLEVSPLPQIVVDAAGFLSLANEQARSMLGVHPSDLGRPFRDLVLSYSPVELRSVIDRVRSSRQPTTISDAGYRQGDAELIVDIDLIPLFGGDRQVLGVLLAFHDVTRYQQLRTELVHANRELETAYEELQSTNEELETTNEELQSTVEELETTNEELHSTNEELETMNDELQSTNDELQTINAELRVRSSELDDVNAFLESILSSLRGGVAVLDPDLRIQVWNSGIEELWGLRADEAQGASFLQLDIGLPVEPLLSDIRACLDGAPRDRSSDVPATNRRGRAITCKVTTSPLRGSDGGVRGVILLMRDGGGQ